MSSLRLVTVRVLWAVFGSRLTVTLTCLFVLGCERDKPAPAAGTADSPAPPQAEVPASTP